MSRLTDLAIKKLAMRKVAAELDARTMTSTKAKPAPPAAAKPAPFTPSAGERVPDEYRRERGEAYVRNPAVPPYVGSPHPYSYGLVPGLERQRINQARRYAEYFGLPGSDVYNNAVKNLIERGENNWYNFNNPKNPRKNPAIPEGIKGTDKEAMFDGLGNMMVYSQPKSNTYYV